MALAAVAVAVVVVLRQHADARPAWPTSTAGTASTAQPFLEGEQPALADLTRADCDDPHDAEVLVLLELDGDQAAAYRPVVPDLVCLDALDDRADVAVDDRAAAGGRRRRHRRSRPTGDALACFGFAADGTRLEGRVKPR